MMSDPVTGADPNFQALVRAQYRGNPRTMAALGARLVVGREAPCAPIDGAALIADAAAQGDAQAWAHMAVLAATGVGRAQNWADAFAALDRAAELRDPDAARALRVVRAMGLRGGADIRTWLAAPEVSRKINDSPRFVSYPDFLTPAVCAYLIERASSRLIQAQVVDAHRGVLKVDPMRTNTGAAFSLIDTDLVMQLVRARIAGAAGVEMNALEPPEILHYAVGERYKPHVDFFHPALPNFAEQMRTRGQRVRTCLVYLNVDFEGGETEFPKLGLRFRGKTGEALVFENVRANGSGDMKTLHAGLPPTRGEKWLLSQWIRSKPQPVG